MKAIIAQQLSKEYRNGYEALKNISIQAEKGEIFSLLGPNGSGKSTLIHILTSFYKPTSGKVEILGYDLERDAKIIRRKIACVPQNSTADSHLTLRENIIFQSRLYKMNRQDAAKKADELIEKFKLKEYLNQPVYTCSGGIKRKLDIAMSIVSMPEILFLDEPTTGLDPASRKELWDIVMALRDVYGTAVFLTTHYLEEAEFLSDRVCIINKGVKEAEGTKRELQNVLKQNWIHAVINKPQHAVYLSEKMQERSNIYGVNLKGAHVYFQVNNVNDGIKEINKELVEADIAFQCLEVMKPSLEDVFFALTSYKHKENMYA